MQFADPSKTWAEWIADNADRTDADKLAALREYIAALGAEWVGHERITAAWVNKKLYSLGVTDLIKVESAYTLQAKVSGNLEMVVYAHDRGEALEKAGLRLDGTGHAMVRELESLDTPMFTKGPEDPSTDVNPDAPTTVAATLAELRELIMLGHVSGPKYCDEGANRVLAEFGLAPIPPQKTFTVTRPVEAVMQTTVTAFDEETALRIAGWRWENNKTGYHVAGGEPTADPSVASS